MLQRAKSGQIGGATNKKIVPREPSLGMHRSAMQFVQDSFDAGNVVAAWLSPGTLGRLEPVLRRLLAGHQLFVKQPDGTYRPKGSELGLARCFEFTDLQAPALSNTSY
jgi:hypothetical protein